MKDVNCPYCGVEIEICHDDGFGYEEGIYHEDECYECEKRFVFTTIICVYHDAFKADCLNDGEHQFKETNTFPHEFTRLKCTTCGLEKNLEKDKKLLDSNSV